MRTLLATLSLLTFVGLAPAKITVGGTGKIVYVPDVGYVSVGVQSEGKTAAEAWEQNRQKIERIFEALKALGLEPRDMQTSGLNVSPRYIHKPNKDPEFVGYTVTYDLRLTIRKLDRMGTVLDRVVENGANRNMSISFGCGDYEKLLDEARTKAVADARKKANLFAVGAGARLGKVLSISENFAMPVRAFAYEHAVAASSDKGIPIAVGEQELTVQVSLEYSLLDEDVK